MTLGDYSRNGWIRAHDPLREEIQDLLRLVARDLRDARTPELSPEWQFDIAYNAVLQAATAALAAEGYRADRANKHARTLETLEFTLGLDRDEVAYLDTCRRKRHVAVYERTGAISEEEARELHGVAGKLRDRLREWLTRQHPGLVP